MGTALIIITGLIVFVALLCPIISLFDNTRFDKKFKKK